jgi:hypothetical protein
MKKILALVLVLSLVLGTFSFAFADGHLPEDIVGEDSEEAVATLMALGVVDGYPDGTYKPERAVTRAEMAKLLVEALGYGELAEGATSTFPDVQGTWAESYVGFAASMDLVIGYPDGTFKPSQQMTMDEAMTMVIRALGYTDEVLKGSWPTNYKVKALDLELTEGLSTLSGEAQRGNVAILLFNALEARLVEVIKDTNGLFTYDFINDGTNDEPDYRLLLDKIGAQKTDWITYDDVFEGDLATAIDLEQYLFHNITYYENADGEVAYVSAINTEMVTGDLTVSGTAITVVDADDEKYDIDADGLGADILYNGDLANTTDLADLDGLEVTVIYDVDEEDVNLAEGIVAWEYDVKIIGSAFDEDVVDFAALTVEGEVDELEDIAVDDVVYYYAADGLTKAKLVVVRDSLTGTVEEIKSDSVVVDGVELDYDTTDFSPVALSDANLGEELTFILDIDGEIADYQDAVEDAPDDYAVVVSYKNGTVGEWQGEQEVSDNPQVKLLTKDGEMIYDVDASDVTVSTNAAIGDYELDMDTEKVTFVDSPIDAFVIFELNDDGEVTALYDVDADSIDEDLTYDSSFSGDFEDPVLGDEYIVEENTIVFDVSVDGDYEAGNGSLLGTGITAALVLDGDDVVAAYVTVQTAPVEEAEDGIYAIFTSVTSVLNSSDDKVNKLVGFVDGEEDTLYTDSDTYGDVSVNVLYEIELTDGEVSGVTELTADVDLTTVTAITSNLVKVDGLYEEVASDAVVYVAEYDTDGDVTITVGDFDDVEVDAYVELYQVDADDEDGADIVILVPEDSYENMPTE